MLLFLNSISFGEIFIILLFVLIFFGAESIPGLARTLGRGIRQVKNATQDIQDEIIKTGTDIKREMNANRALEQTKNAIEKPIQDFTQKLEKSASEVKTNMERELDLEDNHTESKHESTPESSRVYSPAQKKPNVPLDQQSLDENEN